MTNKMKIESLLKSADEALSASGIVITDQEGRQLDDIDIPGEYDGYISGFGPTVVNIGIKAALAFYMKDHSALLANGNENEQTPAKAYRARVVRALALIVKKDNEVELKEFILGKDGKDGKDGKELYSWTQKLVDASVALKLMIRTYKFAAKKS